MVVVFREMNSYNEDLSPAPSPPLPVCVQENAYPETEDSKADVDDLCVRFLNLTLKENKKRKRSLSRTDNNDLEAPKIKIPKMEIDEQEEFPVTSPEPGRRSNKNQNGLRPKPKIRMPYGSGKVLKDLKNHMELLSNEKKEIFKIKLMDTVCDSLEKDNKSSKKKKQVKDKGFGKKKVNKQNENGPNKNKKGIR